MIAMSHFKRIRLRLLAEDPHCRYCGRDLHHGTATVDHIIPRSRGGSSDDWNLCLCCRDCNHRKADLLPAELLVWSQAVAMARGVVH